MFIFFDEQVTVGYDSTQWRCNTIAGNTRTHVTLLKLWTRIQAVQSVDMRGIGTLPEIHDIKPLK